MVQLKHEPARKQDHHPDPNKHSDNTSPHSNHAAPAEYTPTQMANYPAAGATRPPTAPSSNAPHHHHCQPPLLSPSCSPQTSPQPLNTARERTSKAATPSPPRGPQTPRRHSSHRRSRRFPRAQSRGYPCTAPPAPACAAFLRRAGPGRGRRRSDAWAAGGSRRRAGRRGRGQW